MPNYKITELPAETDADTDDVIPVVVDGVTSKVSLASLFAGVEQEIEDLQAAFEADLAEMQDQVDEVKSPPIVISASASYTPVLSDAGKYIILTHASPTFVVPDSGDVAFEDGTILIVIGPNGQITLDFSDVNDPVQPFDTNPKSRIAGSTVALKYVGSDDWHLAGDLEPSE